MRSNRILFLLGWSMVTTCSYELFASNGNRESKKNEAYKNSAEKENISIPLMQIHKGNSPQEPEKIEFKKTNRFVGGNFSVENNRLVFKKSRNLSEEKE